MMIVSIMVMIG
jgi:hypothetical protein